MSNVDKLGFGVRILVFVWVELFAELLVCPPNIFVGGGFVN